MNLHHLALLATECFIFKITTGTPISFVRFGFLENSERLRLRTG